jgi:hypothetical protein
METLCQEPNENNPENISDVVVQNIRKCAGYENISEEEALQVSAFLKEFSTLCYTAFERM